MRTVAFCEVEPYPRAVLAERWPSVPIYGDVRELTAARLAADGIGVDLICGGFPCQDISLAGAGAGIDGRRSGLWSEYARLIGEIRPRYVIVENVAALLGRGIERVLGDLATLGFDAEWHCIPAASVGAPHLRDRVWIIAYASRPGTGLAPSGDCGPGREGAGALEPTLVRQDDRAGGAEGAETGCRAISDAATVGRRERRPGRLARVDTGVCNAACDLANADSLAPVGSAIARQERAPWSPEPEVGRVVDGIPFRVVEPQLAALGNAVVPQIPEIIGRAIMSATAERNTASE